MQVKKKRKTCVDCHEVKPCGDFYLLSSGYRRSFCVECDKKRAREYSLQHRESVALQKHEYYLKNKEGLSDYRRIRYKKNKKLICADTAAYYKTNRPRVLKRNKRYYNENKTLILTNQKEYRDSPKGRLAHERYCKRNKIPMKLRRRRYYHQKKNDPVIKVRNILRGRIKSALYDARVNKVERSLVLVGCSALHFIRHIEKHWKPGMTWSNYGKVWQIDHTKPVCSFDLNKPSHRKRCFHWSNQRPLFVDEHHIKSAKERLMYNTYRS